jgi:hypothetical protein
MELLSMETYARMYTLLSAATKCCINAVIVIKA